MKRSVEVELTDHEFAEYLREHGAVEHYKVYRNSPLVNWSDKAGELVASVLFDNEKSTRRIFIWR